MDKVLGESVEFRIEVEDSPKSVLLVFDRKSSTVSVPFEDAYRLADVIGEVIEAVRGDFKPTPLSTTRAEQGKVRLNHSKGLVHLFVEWTDRLRFTSLDALHLFKQALRQTAQDAMYALRGVHFQYHKNGALKSVVNTKLGYEQRVR